MQDWMMLALMAMAAAGPAAAQPATGPAPIVFFDIAGPDQAKQTAFYRDVFAWQIGAGGNVSVPVVSPLPGTLRADPPVTGLYIGVEDVTAALKSVVDHGGQIRSPRFEVKGVVVLGLFEDPAGNTVGLVEMKNDKPVIP